MQSVCLLQRDRVVSAAEFRNFVFRQAGVGLQPLFH